jgi:phosphate transport system permease protein
LVDAAVEFAARRTLRTGVRARNLLLTPRARAHRRILELAGRALLLLVTASSALAVLFIFYFIIKGAWPFFAERGFAEFFTHSAWRPAGDPAVFGALPIFVGHVLVTLAAAVFAIPFGVLGAVCLSDILPFTIRQFVKPVVEVLAAIPSVAFGFFALVILAPLLQTRGGPLLALAWWIVFGPLAALFTFAASDMLAARYAPQSRGVARPLFALALAVPCALLLYWAGGTLAALRVDSGTNALNAALILAVMAMPTIISVSEDALQAAGRELREGAYALGATRAEMLVRVILPAASSGIAAAVILGVMRVVGETMVVWMASGNAAQIPQPWFNVLAPVRTMTATIAGDMGEADQVTGSMRYHVLWALALVLLVISFVCNLISERFIQRSTAKRV